MEQLKMVLKKFFRRPFKKPLKEITAKWLFFWGKLITIFFHFFHRLKSAAKRLAQTIGQPAWDTTTAKKLPFFRTTIQQLNNSTTLKTNCFFITHHYPPSS